MKRFLLAFSLVLAALPASAQEKIDFPAEALATIRFYTPKPAFEAPLQDAVAQARALKPDAQFHVVLFRGAGNRSEANGQRVVSVLRNVVPPSAIAYHLGHYTPAAYDEVRVFVR